MPAILCRCNRRISVGEIPCSDQWLFISDTQFDAFSGSVDAEEVYKAMKSFIKCPACGRLWVYWNGFQSDPQEYLPGAT
jgi:hypothetical protein